MRSTVTNKPPSIQYPPVTVKFAERALLCHPFPLNLFTSMIKQSLSLGAIAFTIEQNQGYINQLPPLERKIVSKGEKLGIILPNASVWKRLVNKLKSSVSLPI